MSSPGAQTQAGSASRGRSVEGADLKSESPQIAEINNEEESEEDGEALEDEVNTTGNDADWVHKHNATNMPSHPDGTIDAPPLPEEELPPLPGESAPPLPEENLPEVEEDDGWAPVWDDGSQTFYFVNRFTGASQWTNPRVPEVPSVVAIAGPPGVALHTNPVPVSAPPAAAITGYNPAIHGDYDPTAWYAQPTPVAPTADPALDPTAAYQASAAFNRFTGRFQASDINPENHNDENKSKRQMNAFFDVDAAANNHDGRSLREERSNKKISKQELKQFKEKRKAKKEEKRRAWLRD